MNVGLYQGAASMQALEQWQAAVSQNLGAANITGYKKVETDFSSVLNSGSTTSGSTSGSTGSRQMPQANLRQDFSQGELHATGLPEDLAIQGPGYFQVQAPDGQPAYSRDGEFHRSPTNTLVTKTGLPVLGQGGSPLQIDAKKGPIAIARDGKVTQGGTEIGQVSVYNFDEATAQPLSGGLIRPSAGHAAAPVPTAKIESGALENSNVSPIRSMVELITVQRAYEANQKVINAHDQRLSSAIQILGNPQS